jgi:dTMP kinase
MANKKGLIVCFDGPDGVGKTTQLNLAAQSLKDEGYEVFTAKAVGGLPLTDILGQALMLKANRPPETDLHVAIASQYALAGEILPRRDRGEIVLLDRSPLSIIAYQVYGDGLDKDAGTSATKDLLDLLQPDLIVTYFADDETAIQRLAQRNGKSVPDYFESKPRDYHHKVAEGFKFATKEYGATPIDAGAPIELVREATMQLIGQKL